MPFTKAVDPDNGEPPDDAAYQSILLPVAVRFATVGLAEMQ